jgi:very-short-patch-repair endonuclease
LYVDRLDSAVATIAARQHGVVSVAQLHNVGMGKNGITRRVKRGHFHRIHRGVYAIGHRGLSWHGRWMAAVLACGDGAVLSHGSAASLWGLLRPIDGPIHVSTPTTSGRTTRRGVHLHRTPSLAEPSPSPSYSPVRGGRRGRLLVTYRDNIPVTTVPRTIEDLRASPLISPHLVRRAIRQAELKGLRLDGIETDRTRSDLEAAFLAFFRRHRIPPPEVNVKLGRYEVDFLWREEKLVVEADTWTYHRGSISFQADHERDLDLRQQGYAVHRFTDRQLETDPVRVAADIREALS